MNYYILLNGQTVGPMTEDQMMAYPISPETQVCREGGAWAPLYSYPELMQRLQMRGGAGVSMPSQQEVSSKKTMCGIFAIILGGLGIQYFIIGKTAAGLLTILLTIVTCGLWEILTFIQGILMLTMSDADFKRKYVDSTSTLPLF
ncbi:MAG: GYF domain-containing protein [Muribaculaceae bacterium]|nr:GYF domain-containing protein [Muribaculaceae bacterium]